MGPWYRGMTRYHWFVLTVAALGWLFDCLDQQLFNLARKPAMETLLAAADAASIDPKAVNFYGGLSTCIFMLGWATGGLIFGVVGDRLGRAKTMMITIVIYSLCTGLSALSYGFWDFAFYRFITGLGVGGEFAVGVALVAEVMPDRARPYALGLLAGALRGRQLPAAALIGIGLGQAQLHMGSKLYGWEPWRWKFVIGALPAVLALVIRAGLKEPERWQQMKARAAEDGRETRWLRCALRRPALAQKRDPRDAPRLLGRDRPVGHRLLLDRPPAQRVREDVQGPGALRAGVGRPAHDLDRRGDDDDPGGGVHRA
jgi:MFS family permease